MGRFVSATGQFLLTIYRQFSRPPTGSFSCPLTPDPAISAERFEPVRFAPACQFRCKLRSLLSLRRFSIPSGIVLERFRWAFTE